MKPWLRKWVGRPAAPDRGRPLRSPVEALEDRVTPAAVTWDGAPDGGGTSPDADWTTPANWLGDAAPAPGDTLVFPAGPTARAAVNTFPAGTPFALSVTGPGYTLSGNAIGLAGSLQSSGGAAVVAAPLVLTADAGVGASAGTLTLTAGIDLGAHTLTVDAAEAAVVTLGGVVSGPGGLAKAGNGEAVLTAANTYSGPTVVSAGTLRVTDPHALGAADGTAATGTTVVGTTSPVGPRPALVLDGSFAVAGEKLVVGTGEPGRLAALRATGAVAWTGAVVLTDYVTVDLKADAGGSLAFEDVSGGAYRVYVGAGGPVVLGGTVALGGGPGPAATVYVDSGGGTLALGGAVTGVQLVRVLGSVVVSGPASLSGDLEVGFGGRVVASPAAPGAGLAVAGAVALDGAVLELAPGYVPAVGEVLTLVANGGADPVAGSFDGLPEGAVFTPDAGGTYYRVSYVGGDGNDVTVTRVAVATWDGGGADANWTTAANWAGDAAPAAGATLVFPAGAARPASVNDFPAGTAFGVTVTGPGYTLSGNAVALAAGRGLLLDAAGATVLAPLVLSGDGFVSSLAGTLTLSGPVDVGAHTLTLSAALGSVVAVGGVVSGAGGLEKAGSGEAVLAAANTYAGPTVVAVGTLRVTDPHALGAADGTAATGTTVESYAVMPVGLYRPALLLDGSFVVAGERLVMGAGSPDSFAALRATGAAGWSGPVELTDYVVADLGAGGALTLGPVAGGAYRVYVGGPVVLAGPVTLGSGPGPAATVYVDAAGSLTVGAPVTGVAAVVVTGAGSLVVAGPGSLGGDLELTATGRLVVAPAGPSAGLAVAGTVTLAGAALDVTPGYVPAVGEVLTPIANGGADPVMGTFAGLPEGAVFTPDLGGTYYRISYAGGDGNDVTLTTLSANHAPVLTPAAPALGATDEDTAVAVGPAAFVNAGPGTTAVTDADAPADLRGVALVATTGRGTWSYSLDGSAFAPVGAVSELSALLLGGTAVLRYQPDGANGETPTVTYRAWDQSRGTAGDRAPVAGAVLTSAFSAAADTAALTVTAVNDAPTVVGGTPLALDETDEDTVSPPTTVAALLAAAAYADVDAGAAAGVAVTGAAGRGVWQFSTDGATWTDFGAVSGGHALLLASGGRVRYRPDQLNGETAGLTFRAWDRTAGTASAAGAPAYADPGAGGGTSAFSAATHAAQLAVADRNDAPTAAALSATVVTENAAAGTPVGTLSATDPDTTPQSFTYILVAGTGAADNARFSIAGAVLRLNEAPDFEGQASYSVRVRVIDQGALAFDQVLTVTVTDVNEAPTALALAPAAVAENTPAGTAVGTLSATDPDTTPQSFTYSLVTGAGDDDNGRFTVVGAELRLAEVPDFEGQSSYSVRVRVTDQGGLTFERSLTVAVTDVNETPAGPVLAPAVVAENAAVGSTVGVLTPADPDAAGTYTYALVAGAGAGDNARFTISGDELRLTEAPDFEARPGYSVRVRVTDQGGLASEQVLTIAVTDVNEAPDGLALSATVVAENAAAGTPVGTISATDPDAAPQPLTYALTAGAGDGDNDRFVVVGNELRLAAPPDFEAQAEYHVRVRVTDPGGLALDRAFTVTVLDVNEAPVGPGALSATAHPDEPFAYTLSADAFTDPDAGDALTYAAAGLPAWLSFDAAARRFTGTPGADDATAHVTVTATDAAGATGTLTLTVFVAAPAGPPDLGPVRPVAVGGAADGTVRLVAADGTETVVAPFGDTGGAPTRTVAADVDGDGIADVIAVTGPGTGLRVAVLSGADGHVLVPAYDPFGGGFAGGGFVSAADLDGDGRAEFVVTPDQGGGPRVSVVSLNPDGSTTTLANFLGIDDANFRGGARAAVGDVNHDGVPDLVVAAGFGGGPRVSVYDGRSVGGTPTRLINDFFAFPGADAQSLRNGAFAAVGDVTGDGFADLVFGGGPGGAPRVFILSGALIAAGDVNAAYAAPVANFFVGEDATARGGARVGVTNADGDARADVAVGSGPGEPARVRLYLGKDFAGGGEPPSADLDPFDGAVLADGVYVG